MLHTFSRARDIHLCSGLCEGSCLSGAGCTLALHRASQPLCPLTPCLHPSRGGPRPRRPGHLDPIDQRLCLQHSRQLPQRVLSSPKRPNGHQTVDPNPRPSAHPKAPWLQVQVATASSTGSRLATETVWSSAAVSTLAPLIPESPGEVSERTLTQASPWRCRVGLSGIGVQALVFADSTQVVLMCGRG